MSDFVNEQGTGKWQHESPIMSTDIKTADTPNNEASVNEALESLDPNSKEYLLHSTHLQVAGVVKESVVDGPGIRYTIFTQGCPFHCKGCHNPQAQKLQGGINLALEDLYKEIKENPLISGVTFSGGEPFIQAKALSVFAKILRKEGYNVWSYSGYTFEKLIEQDNYMELLKTIDILVDGPFVISKRSYDIDYRGSTNQRIINVPESLEKGYAIVAEGFQ